jgi:hypothetical protein
MQRRKIGIVMTLMLFSIISTGGCTTIYKDMKSWEGRTINDLYFEWGKADEVGSLNTGGRVHTWYFERMVDGQVKTCTKSFYTRYDGHAEVIIDTSYKDCLFLIAN